ncbi:MAG: hypothetical protein CMQ51_07015 [Gammaproteobacteria bacterium]|nr:hypothetical protein [Gammaproteobacteria bacterium]|tara:strand:+ start:315 stop:512 length:198 start_codon:yes stop_codon:yes gene_type:complete
MKTFLERLEELRAEQRKNLHIGPQPLYLSAPEFNEWRIPQAGKKPDTSDKIETDLEECIIDFDIS